MAVPRLFSVCQSELQDEPLTISSGLRELKMEPLKEDTPFLWAQALYLIAKLTRKGT